MIIFSTRGESRFWAHLPCLALVRPKRTKRNGSRKRLSIARRDDRRPATRHAVVHTRVSSVTRTSFAEENSKTLVERTRFKSVSLFNDRASMLWKKAEQGVAYGTLRRTVVSWTRTITSEGATSTHTFLTLSPTVVVIYFPFRSIKKKAHNF